jgi:hypothetical protein
VDLAVLAGKQHQLGSQLVLSALSLLPVTVSHSCLLLPARWLPLLLYLFGYVASCDAPAAEQGPDNHR